MELEIKNKTLYSILWVLFVLYLMLLIRVLFFKYGFSMSLLMSQDRRIISNFIPLKTIAFYLLTSDVNIAVRQLLGNIIAFSPMGFFLPFLFRRIKGIVIVSIVSFTISLLCELIQLLTNLGSFDIDDMLLNTFGAIVGFIVYKAIINFFFRKTDFSFKV